MESYQITITDPQGDAHILHQASRLLKKSCFLKILAFYIEAILKKLVRLEHLEHLEHLEQLEEVK